MRAEVIIRIGIETSDICFGKRGGIRIEMAARITPHDLYAFSSRIVMRFTTPPAEMAPRFTATHCTWQLAKLKLCGVVHRRDSVLSRQQGRKPGELTWMNEDVV